MKRFFFFLLENKRMSNITCCLRRDSIHRHRVLPLYRFPVLSLHSLRLFTPDSNETYSLQLIKDFAYFISAQVDFDWPNQIDSKCLLCSSRSCNIALILSLHSVDLFLRANISREFYSSKTRFLLFDGVSCLSHSVLRLGRLAWLFWLLTKHLLLPR